MIIFIILALFLVHPVNAEKCLYIIQPVVFALGYNNLQAPQKGLTRKKVHWMYTIYTASKAKREISRLYRIMCNNLL